MTSEIIIPQDLRFVKTIYWTMKLEINIGQIITSALAVFIISILTWQIKTLREVESDLSLTQYRVDMLEKNLEKKTGRKTRRIPMQIKH